MSVAPDTTKQLFVGDWYDDLCVDLPDGCRGCPRRVDHSTLMFSDAYTLSRTNGADLADALAFAEEAVGSLPKGYDPHDSRQSKLIAGLTKRPGNAKGISRSFCF